VVHLLMDQSGHLLSLAIVLGCRNLADRWFDRNQVYFCVLFLNLSLDKWRVAGSSTAQGLSYVKVPDTRWQAHTARSLLGRVPLCVNGYVVHTVIGTNDDSEAGPSAAGSTLAA
jgi:hypothetical protein